MLSTFGRRLSRVVSGYHSHRCRVIIGRDRVCSNESLEGKGSRLKYTTSYQPGNERGGFPLVGKTIGQVLDETTERQPDDQFLVFSESGQKMTFAQFREEMDRLAAGLVSLGVERGDRVGIWGPNSLEWTLTMYAAARIGAILVNLNPAYQTGEIEYTLKKVGVKTVIASRPFKTQKYYDMLSEICPELETASPGRLQSKRLPSLDTVIMMGDERHPGSFVFDDVLNMGTSEHYNVIDHSKKTLQFDDIIDIQFTSGTTGAPKATCLTHFNILNDVYSYAYALSLGRDQGTDRDKLCLPLPLFHTSGMILSTWCMAMGQLAVFPSSGFDSKTCLQAMHDERCTDLAAVPTMFIDMYNHPDFSTFDLSSIKRLLSGASNVPPEVRRKIESSFNNASVQVGYGITEATGLVTLTLDTDPEEARNTSVGRPLPWMEIKVVDPSTNEVVDVDTKGELCIRGPCVMIEYWGDADKTKETVDQARWLHTGDLATMDKDGYISIVGRSKDVVIRGGVNIFPVQIEHVIYTHPKVQDVQVVGVPDKRMIEELCACIKLKSGEECSEDEIRDFCKGKMSHYMVPRYVQFVDGFPMTASGKVRKFKLGEEMAERLDLA